MLLKKWEPFKKKPIYKVIDIVYDEATITEYYVGMKTINNRRSIIWYKMILSNEKLYKTKQHPSFRQWLSTNRVWVRPTNISSSSHVKVGWLTKSHPTYTNFNKVT